MCGIYGVLSRDSAVDSAALPVMEHALRHRGPDDGGTLLDGPCALGMRRLSIIDVDGGRQPIASEDHGVWVVFNGEIYNYRALRRTLIQRGHRLVTSSDTEVIVHLYEDHGDEFVEHLRGMFAIAIWDRRRGTLTLARDRLGIKPLYYAETSAGLVFASELKSVLVHPSVAREIDPVALSYYVSFGTTPIDTSIVRGVRKLPPAHVLRAEAGRVRYLQRYWDLRPSPTAEIARGSDATEPPPEAIERVRALLSDAVESHLESDVPVGAFLSGGVDSATVVAEMVRSGRRPYTFSIGFQDRDFDELRYARMVAEHFGTRHEELVVSPDVWALIGELVPFLDEPFADSSAIPTYLVSRLAARRVKVVLSGDGGDEVFGGYDHYAEGLTDARRYDRLPQALRDLLGAAAAALPQIAPGKRWLRHASLPARTRFLDGEAVFDADLKRRLLAPAFAAELERLGAGDPIETCSRLLASAPGDTLGRLLYLDTMTYLPLDILTKVDRMSMAHGLEVRPPLLDTPLVEAVAAMPSAWKMRGGARKILLKRAMASRLPEEILTRAKKGFGVPVRPWFRGPLRDVVADVLFDPRTTRRGLFDPAMVRALVAEHRSGRRDRSMQLWALVVLELWTRMVIDDVGRVPTDVGAPREALRG